MPVIKNNIILWHLLAAVIVGVCQYESPLQQRTDPIGDFLSPVSNRLYLYMVHLATPAFFPDMA